jgi:ribosomal protein S18 acetylase RimI-like enzyme
MDAALAQKFPPAAHGLRSGRRVTLRPLLPADADALGDFYEAIPREDFRFYYPHPLTREKAAENAKAADDPRQVVVVLETDEGAIGGYAWFRWRQGAESSGFGICVRRDLQGTGAGRLLMTRLLEMARCAGPPAMHLTVQKANARAVALYRSVGFAVVREQTRRANPELGFDEEPEYYMERTVR